MANPQNPTNNQATATIQSSQSLELAQVRNITWANLPLLRPEWLLDDGILYSLKLFVLDITDGGDSIDVSNCFNVLYSLLKKIPRLVNERPDMFQEYLRLLAVLKASFLTIVPMPDILTFFRENLLNVLEVQDFDLSAKINKLLILSSKFPEVFETERKQYVKALEENKELFGTSGLKMENKNVEQDPTVANWLFDYNQFSVSYAPPLRSNIPQQRAKQALGGSLQRVAYMQKNENVRHLSKDEKAILFKLFELYDWLRTVKPTSEFVPAFSSYMQEERFEIPEEEKVLKPGDDQTSQAGQPTRISMADIMSKAGVVSKTTVAEQPSKREVPPVSFATPPSTPPSAPAMPSPEPIRPQAAGAGVSLKERLVEDRRGLRSVNIQDILHRRSQEEEKVGGLKLGDGQSMGHELGIKKQESISPGLQSASPTLEEGKKDKSLVDIDKKLDELKKRTNKLT